MTTFKVDKETVEVSVTLAFKRGKDPMRTLQRVQEILNAADGVEAFLVESVEEENFALFENDGSYGLWKKSDRDGVWDQAKWAEYREARTAEDATTNNVAQSGGNEE